MEQGGVLGLTSIIIATALITEYFHTLHVNPSILLSGLASRLRTCPGMFVRNRCCILLNAISTFVAIVQEPCILAMIRVSADCDEIPPNIRDVIGGISQTGSHVVRNVRGHLDFLSQKNDLLSVALNLWSTLKRKNNSCILFNMHLRHRYRSIRLCVLFF